MLTHISGSASEPAQRSAIRSYKRLCRSLLAFTANYSARVGTRSNKLDVRRIPRLKVSGREAVDGLAADGQVLEDNVCHRILRSQSR